MTQSELFSLLNKALDLEILLYKEGDGYHDYKRKKKLLSEVKTEVRAYLNEFQTTPTLFDPPAPPKLSRFLQNLMDGKIDGVPA